MCVTFIPKFLSFEDVQEYVISVPLGFVCLLPLKLDNFEKTPTQEKYCCLLSFYHCHLY